MENIDSFNNSDSSEKLILLESEKSLAKILKELGIYLSFVNKLILRMRKYNFNNLEIILQMTAKERYDMCDTIGLKRGPKVLFLKKIKKIIENNKNNNNEIA